MRSVLVPIALLSLPFAASAIGRAARVAATPPDNTIPDPDAGAQPSNRPRVLPWRSEAHLAALAKLKTSDWWSSMGISGAVTMYDAVSTIQRAPRIRNPQWLEFPLLSATETKRAIAGLIAALEAGVAAMPSPYYQRGGFALAKDGGFGLNTLTALAWLKSAANTETSLREAPVELTRLGRDAFTHLYTSRYSLSRTPNTTSAYFLGGLWRSMVYAALVMDEVGVPIGGQSGSVVSGVLDSVKVGLSEATHTLGDVGWAAGGLISTLFGSAAWAVLSSPAGLVAAGAALWWLYEQ